MTEEKDGENEEEEEDELKKSVKSSFNWKLV